MRIEYKQIGTIRTPFKSIEGMPIQPAGAELVPGTVEVSPEYSEGLKDLEGFSHIILIYHFHKVTESKLIVTPFMDDQPRGVFATRAPKRPNPIGISVVRLVEIEGSTLKVENVDMFDGTPLIDIKPYVPDFDQYPADRVGWLEHAKEGVKEKKSDSRFR
jgi:tRNA-Thr(GGU) m(6)t(6)A37 methyltransferase TsaA